MRDYNFKIGDLVKIIDISGGMNNGKGIYYKIGDVVQILGFSPYGSPLIDEFSLKKNSGWSIYRFELVSRPGETSPTVSTSIPSPGAPLNDRSCPACKNSKCSSDEKSCWLCGYIL